MSGGDQGRPDRAAGEPTGPPAGGFGTARTRGRPGPRLWRFSAAWRRQATSAGGAGEAESRRLVADVEGHGPPVVVLHGQPGSAVDWQRVIPLLSARFTVIAPDRPGYGRTGGVAADFTENAVAVAHLLDDLSVPRATIVGYSWGGGVALAFAQLFPARTAGLVLAASVGPGERFRWEDRILAAPLLGDALAALTLGMAGPLIRSTTLKRLADRHLAGRTREAVSVLRGLITGRGDTRVWRSFVIEQRVLLRDIEGLGPGLARMTAPTAVVNGSADRLVPPQVARRLTAEIPGAVHTVIAGAHHLLLLNQPEAIASAVEQVAAETRS
jgi:pimeloyl-ACP methyl ester carboxylesterase